jgi:molybdopterin-guanine dinucleotide biosynthesis protein A
VPRSEDITGLVLAGGQGRRMGGRDKGLQPWQGEPLVQHALRRLQPQVARLAVSANRHLDDYRALGAPVWPDTLPGFAGPLAGWLSALQHCETPWLASVPCDTPGFPADLVARLSAALETEGAKIAVAATPARLHPVFCLLSRDLADDLRRYLQGGQRKVQGWTAQQRCAVARFDDEAAFRNFNTLADLESR